MCAIQSRLLPVLAAVCMLPAVQAAAGTFRQVDIAMVDRDMRPAQLLPVTSLAQNTAMVEEVHFPTGRYVKLPGGMWQEYGPEGAYGQLQETGRNEHSIYLYDSNANADLQLNIMSRQIFFRNRTNGSNGPGDPIANVIFRGGGGNTSIGTAISEDRYSYACNNGINIEARHVIEGSRRTLFARNAGAPVEVRLDG